MAYLISAYLVFWLWWIKQQYATHIAIHCTQRQSIQILEQTFGVTYCVCNGWQYWRADSTHRLRLKAQVIDIRSCTLIVKLYQVWKNRMDRWNCIIFNSLRTTFSNYVKKLLMFIIKVKFLYIRCWPCYAHWLS